jgi:hypothetical protein
LAEVFSELIYAEYHLGVAAARNALPHTVIDAQRVKMSPYPAQDPVMYCDQPEVHVQRLSP